MAAGTIVNSASGGSLCIQLMTITSHCRILPDLLMRFHERGAVMCKSHRDIYVLRSLI